MPSNGPCCTAARRCNFHEESRTNCSANHWIRRNWRVPPPHSRDRYYPGRFARQLSDQPGDCVSRSPQPPTLAAFIDELDRARALGLLGVVIHPGVCTTGTEEAGLELIADAIRTAFKARPRRKTMVLLEHTAGQGRTLGYRFEHLAAIIDQLSGSPRVGVASTRVTSSHLDTTSPPTRAIATPSPQFDRIVGLDRLKVFHGNDSKRPCGSRVDRHEHIGQGCIGLEPFRRLSARSPLQSPVDLDRD